MNCEKYEQPITELARNQLIDANVRAATLQHLSTCEICSTLLGEQQQLTNSLRVYAGAARNDMDPTIENNLRLAFRAEQEKRVVKSSFSRRKIYWGSAAAAAAVLIVIGLVLTLKVGLEQPTTHEATATNKVQPNSEITPPAPTPQLVDTPEARPRPTTKRRTHSRIAPNRSDKPETLADLEPEIMTTFIPIGYSTPATVQEGGQVVRVELPRSTMARFGLPVNMERYDERVKADVLLSADGMARAIRFVQ